MIIFIDNCHINIIEVYYQETKQLVASLKYYSGANLFKSYFVNAAFAIIREQKFFFLSLLYYIM